MPKRKRPTKRRKHSKHTPLLLPIEAGTLEEFAHRLNECAKLGYILFPDSIYHTRSEFFASHSALVYLPKKGVKK